MNQLDWNAWTPFSEWRDNSHVPASLGVYQVRACESKRNPVAISRCCGVDSDGLLYIGEGKLNDRLGKLQYLGFVDGKAHHQFIDCLLYTSPSPRD